MFKVYILRMMQFLAGISAIFFIILKNSPSFKALVFSINKTYVCLLIGLIFILTTLFLIIYKKILFAIKNKKNSDFLIDKQLKNYLLSLKKTKFFVGKKKVLTRNMPCVLSVNLLHDKISLLNYSGINFLNKNDDFFINNDSLKCFISDKIVFLEIDDMQIYDKLSTQNDNKHKWEQFLYTLKKYLPKYHTTGLILNLDIINFFEKIDNEKEYLIQKLNNTLKELQDVSHTNLFVYVNITCSAKITGFLDFFKNFEYDDQDQIMGFTLSQKNINSHNFRQILSKEYNNFLLNIDRNLIFILSKEKDQNTIEKICFFPQQLRLYKDIIIETLYSIMIMPHLSLILRGVYFTAPIMEPTKEYNLLENITTKKFSITNKEHVTYLSNHSPFFFKELYNDLIAKEMNISFSQNKGNNYKVIFFCSAIILFIFLQEFYLLKEYFEERKRNYNVINYLNEYNKSKSFHNYSSINQMLIKLSYLKHTLELYSKPINNKFIIPGILNLSHKKEEEIVQLLHKRIKNELLPMLAKQIEDFLETYDNSSDAFYTVLKGYFFLSDPEKYSINWLVAALKCMDETIDDDLHDDLVSYSEIIKQYPDKIQIKPHLVAKSSNMLINELIPDKIYSQVKNKVSYEMLSKINLIDISNKDMKVFESNSKYINEFFTSYGLENLYSKNVATVVKNFNDEMEILNNYLPKDLIIQKSYVDGVIAEVNKLYIEEYINNWQDVIAQFKLVSMHNFNQISDTLNFLEKENNSFDNALLLISESLDAICKFASHNKYNLPINNLEIHDTSIANEAVKTQKLILNDTKKILNEFVTKIMHDSDVLYASFVVTKNSMDEGNNPIDSIFNKITKLPMPLNNIYNQLTMNLFDILLENTHIYLVKKYKDIIFTSLENIKKYYPVDKKSKHTLNFDEFVSFFGPNGRVNNFYETYLKSFTCFNDTGIHWKNKFENKLQISKNLLDSMSRLLKISFLFFSNSNQDLSLKFSMSPLYLSQEVANLVLNINGNIITYSHGPTQEYKFTWSCGQVNKPITIDFHDFDGVVHTVTYEGPWALFKLIDSGTLSSYSGASDKYLFEIKIKNMRANFVLNMPNADKIFKKTLLIQ